MIYYFNRLDVFDQNAKNADFLIGQDGYFGNNLDQIKRAIQFKHIGILQKFSQSSDEFIFVTQGKRAYKMFLPSSKLQTFDQDEIIVIDNQE